MKDYKKLEEKFNKLKDKYSKVLKENNSLKGLVYKDSLTKLYNQKFLQEELERKIQSHKRYGEEFSVLFIDVDHFKRVNDNNGHLVGSKILVQLGDLIKKNLRRTDYAFRYGGDEFVVILSQSKLKQAKTAAEKIRKAVEGESFSEGLKITVSVGIAGVPHHIDTAEGVLKMADEAMYEGKKQGRNTVYFQD